RRLTTRQAKFLKKKGEKVLSPSPWSGEKSNFEISGEDLIMSKAIPQLDSKHPFVYKTLKTRLPGILERTIEYNKETLTKDQIESIQHFLKEIVNDAPIRLISDQKEDAKEWNKVLQVCVDKKQTWTTAPWFVWETYVYRRLLQASQYWDTKLDLFKIEKSKSLIGTEQALKQRAKISTQYAGKWDYDTFRVILFQDLWGNQADGSLFTVDTIAGLGSTKGHGENTDRVLVNDTKSVWNHLNQPAKQGHRVIFFNDNSGLEIVSDLVLASYLLHSKKVSTVEFYLKPYPYFVSDANPEDVKDTIEFLISSHDKSMKELGADLKSLVKANLLKLKKEHFLASPLAMSEMPKALKEDIKSAHLLVVKGDLMYRKMLGDRMHPPQTPFKDIVSYFPCPIVSLRTCKSPVIVGMTKKVFDELSAEKKDWTCLGLHGTIHFVNSSSAR
ncbi:hypothetical protein AAMO2058_001692400, partial [Amorphochlora amoebiformis]